MSNTNINPSSSAQSKKRVYINIFKKIKNEYESYSQKDGHNTISEALRSGIKQCEEGSLVLKTDIDEKTKINEILGKIVDIKDLKYDTYNTEIRLEENLLQRFDRLILQKGLKSRNRAIREIIYAQILEMKNKYEASVNAEKTITVEPKDLKKLKQDLEDLKQTYGLGLELDVVWTPKVKSKKEAEVIGNKIYIYSLTYEEAEFWLEHEYHEYCQHVTSSKPLVDAMNLTLIFWKMVMEYFNNEGYKKREKYIETLLKNLKKKQATS